MKKCKGCGVEMQNIDNKALGYTPDLEKDYCMRCFRLTHYNDAMIDTREMFNEDPLYKIALEKEKALIVYVIDILSYSSFLNTMPLRNYKNHPFVLLINKIDLLPKNANFQKIEKRIINDLQKEMNGLDLKAVLLSRKNDPYFKELFFETLDKIGIKEVIFAGSFNAGKSTLLNNLSSSKTFTSSSYPGTTLDYNEITIDDYTFYDSPGSLDKHNFLMNVPYEYLVALSPQKCLKPAVYQLYEPQSYIIDDLLRLDVDTHSNSSIVFYIGADLPLHRTKKEKADAYIFNHHDEFKYHIEHKVEYHFNNIKRLDFEIDGFGFVTLKDIKEATFYLPEGTAIYPRKVLL